MNFSSRNKFTLHIKIAIIAAVLTFGVHAIFAGTWQAPLDVPGSFDVSVPIDVTSTPQEKQGKLGIYADPGTENYDFRVAGNASFDGGVWTKSATFDDDIISYDDIIVFGEFRAQDFIYFQF